MMEYIQKKIFMLFFSYLSSSVVVVVADDFVSVLR
jgi:hypothetical protein